MPEDVKPFGQLKPYNPNEGQIKPVGKLKKVGEIGTSMISDFGSEGLELDNEDKVNQIIQNIPDLDDSKKEIIKDLAKKGASRDDLKNSILTLQGNHPRQSDIDKGTALLTGGLGDLLGKTTVKYYFNDKGMPVPLKPDERPPVGFEVASTWGTQQDANDDNTITSLGKHLWNGVIGAAEGIVSLPEMAYRATTGKESDIYHKFQNEAESVKFKTPEYEKKPMYDFEGIKDYEDLFKTGRWIPDLESVQGVVFGGLETGLSFILGTKGLGAVGKIAGAAGKGAGLLKAGTLVDETGQVLNKGSQLTNFIEGTSNAGKLGQAYTTSYVQNYKEAYDAASEAGLEGKDKLAFAGVATIPLAMLDVAFGTEGLLTKNMLAKSAKKEMYKKLGEGFVKDSEGKITEESLKKLFKESIVDGTKLNKSFVRELGATMGEEALTEGAQAITLETAKEIYDKVSKDHKFNTEVFSAENVGKYINEIMSGGIGAMGVGAYGVNQSRRMEKEEAKKNNAFNVVKNGAESVNSFNKNVNLALENGEISQEDADAAKFKVRTYQEYYEQTKGTKLSDDNKKRLFELTFEKANLEAQIPTEYEKQKLNGILQGQIDVKEKEAKEIQSEINKILLADEILKKDTTTSKKTIEEVDKHLSPEKPKEGEVKFAGSLKELYEKHAEDLGSLDINPVKKEKKVEPVETRLLDDIPAVEWNDQNKTSYSKRFNILSEHLAPKGKPVKSQLGAMRLESNDTVHITLPNGKFAIFASSATDRKRGHRGWLHIENLPKDFDGHKVVIKPKQLTTGRTILPVYNAETGKHVGFVREQNTGKAKEKWFTNRAAKLGIEEAERLEKVEEEELGHLKTEPLTEQEIEYYKSKNIADEAKTTTRPLDKVSQGSEIITPEVKETQPKTEKVVKEKYEPAESEAESDLAKSALTTEDNTKLEPIIEAIESKANSNKEPELIEAVKESVALIESATDVVNLPISEISVDEKRFQNRDELDRDIVKSISENFDENQFDPIVVWKQGDKIFVLAGHHRFEGAKQAGKTSVKVRYFSGTEAQAIEFATEKSNANRTMENPVERAKIYREKLAKGESKKSVEEQAKQNEGKNASFYLNIAALSPNGMAIQTYNSFKQSEDKATQKEIEKILDWTGDVRRAYPDLTDQHEQELFEFLFNKESSKRITTKSDFKQKITTIVGTLDFDATKPLNIARFKYKTEGENLYEKEVAELKARIEATQDKITTLKDRFVNPKNAEYIPPTHKDYNSIKKLADDKIVELNNKQQSLNTELLNLYKEKGKYIDSGSNQGELFQKKKTDAANLEAEHHAKVFEVTKRIQEALPKITVLYDKTLMAAGKLSADGKTISINPYYAGIDTPIHEPGHVLIDAIGYNNSIIQKAIEQLKGTELYKQTKERYPITEIYTEEMLNKEVLAEAIGREGERIFDTEVQKNVFMKYLDYIFNRLKQLLGIDRNIAKSLAQQIIGGIGTKELTGTNTGKEQLQEIKEEEGEEKKKKYKTFAEKSEAERIRNLTVNFETYQDKVLGHNPYEEADNFNKVEEKLSDPNIIERDAEIWNRVKDNLDARKRKDLSLWYAYREDMKEAISLYEDIAELQNKAEAGEISEEEMQDGFIELYNELSGFQKFARESVEGIVKLKLANALKQQQKKIASKNKNFIEEVADKGQIGALAVRLMNLGHATEKTLELQSLSKIFDSTHLDMTTEKRDKKNTFEKLAKKVIEEDNKKNGIKGKAVSLISNDSAAYFEYMDNGSGDLLTLNEAKAKGLSEAQIDFLKYTRELVAEHKKMILDEAVYNMPLQIMKTDATFVETFRAEGVLQAFSNFLGTNYNIKKVRIPFTNPDTKITETKEFGEIEKEILEYGKKGVKEKATALWLLVKYNIKAKKQLKTGVNFDEKDNPLLIKNNSEFSLNENGVLSSKFDKPRDKNRGYSKDFYRAGIEFIDDMMHVKHMSKLVPIADSIKYLNEKGIADEHGIKPNVVKWVEEWRDMHLFKNPKENTPEIDVALRFLRGLTSATTMMFNVPAGVLNLFMGVYNNWRAENSAKVAIGHKILFGKFGKHKVNKDYAYGSINPYAVDILRKFDVVSNDFDSNPKFNVLKFFTELGHALTRYGEFQIQGSMFLGLMKKEEYESFEYKKNKQGIDELVFKETLTEAEKKALKEKMISYKKRVSDIQGKYADKDRRNIMNGELGKAVFQFKVWMPDWFRLRFGKRHIDEFGQTQEGSWTTVFNGGLSELRKQIKSKGFKETFLTNQENKSLEAKNILSNIKGLMAVAFFWSLANMDDDDDNRKKTALDAQNAYSQLMFIFDPNTLKWTATRPVAALGTVEKLINIVQDISDADAKKALKDARKVLPANKAINIIESVTE